MAKCRDCFYCEVDSSKIRIANCFCRKKLKRVRGSGNCSNFVPKAAYSCSNCIYAEANTSRFAKKSEYYCKERKRKVKSDDLACSRFIAN